VTPHRLFIGFDVSELYEWNVARLSAQRHSRAELDIQPIDMTDRRVREVYRRPTLHKAAGYWDVISDAPMSTAHAIARFLVPYLCEYVGWALFTDGDVLFRRDVGELFALADPRYAVQVVQHQHIPLGIQKMQGHVQTAYPRKNQSSVMLFQCGHPSNRALTPKLVNTVPGRDLHRFCWLQEEEIGGLPREWNHLVNVSEPHPDPAIVHFTLGSPAMAGYERCPYADEWYAMSRLAGIDLSRPARLDERAAV
jgi:hypothetical protein